MKQFTKRFLYWAAPQTMTAIMSIRARRHSQRVIASWGCASINQRLKERFGDQVQGGPFKGMRLAPSCDAEQLGPYLLGVYESELASVWPILFQGTYTQIIDIGAKFGFYAVGLGARFTNASVIAFDTDWWARKATAEMALLNNARNVQVKGYCTSQWLEENVEDSALIICDCDGFEGELFTSRVIAKLNTATLVIETHDCFLPGVEAALRKAFQNTHDVTVLGSQNGRETPVVDLSFFNKPELELATQEVRPEQTWLLCLPMKGVNRILIEHSQGSSHE